MRPFAIFAPILIAGPALAHEGAHLHPHGIDGAWAFLAGTLLGGAAVAMLVRARRK
jgi:hypothetical protein